MSPPIIDLTGQRFGRWTVVSLCPERGHGAIWLCCCDCGTERTVPGKRLRSGKSRSCGCLMRELTGQRFFKHGLSETSIYHRWEGMKQRCLNPNHMYYFNYGGRGIGIYEGYCSDFVAYHADVGDPPGPGLNIDRIDVNGHYSPGNLRWADQSTQVRNQRRCSKKRGAR